MVDYDSLELTLAAWAGTQLEVIALVVVGSRARADHPADAWSDLDLILFTTAPDLYTANADSLTARDGARLIRLGHTGRGDAEWLILFAGGRKVDCVIAPVPQSQSGATVQDVLAASPYQFVYERGVRILYARNIAQGAALEYAVPRTTAVHPSAKEFYALVDGTLFSATRNLKFLGRGDLWRAKQICDGEMKQQLLTMLAWHARALHGLEYDTWHDGRYLEQWADPRALSALPQTFGAYDRTDLRRALAATLDLVNRLAQEIAGRLGFPYPSAARAQTLAWLRQEANA
jgi:aminoglycoside 6-adenylyltransferase